MRSMRSAIPGGAGPARSLSRSRSRSRFLSPSRSHHVHRHELRGQELQASPPGQRRLPPGPFRCGRAGPPSPRGLATGLRPLPPTPPRRPSAGSRAWPRRPGPAVSAAAAVLQGSAAPPRSASWSASAATTSRAAPAESSPWPICSAAWRGKYRGAPPSPRPLRGALWFL